MWRNERKMKLIIKGEVGGGKQLFQREWMRAAGLVYLA